MLCINFGWWRVVVIDNIAILQKWLFWTALLLDPPRFLVAALSPHHSVIRQQFGGPVFLLLVLLLLCGLFPARFACCAPTFSKAFRAREIRG